MRKIPASRMTIDAPGFAKQPVASTPKPSVALATAARAASAVVRGNRRPCVLCGRKADGTSEVKVGPFYAFLCEKCSSGVFHTVGVLDWFLRMR